MRWKILPFLIDPQALRILVDGHHPIGPVGVLDHSWNAIADSARWRVDRVWLVGWGYVPKDFLGSWCGAGFCGPGH